MLQLQNQRRARKKNTSVNNRSGQPDTPFQRLGKHSMAVPANSPSFFAYDNVDSDEETWEQGKAFRIGSSRDGRRDSLTSHMSEMSRGAHETDSNAYFVSDPPRSVKGTESRSSMLQKYSRAVGSAHARKDASFSSKHGLYLISGYDFFS